LELELELYEVYTVRFGSLANGLAIIYASYSKLPYDVYTTQISVVV